MSIGVAIVSFDRPQYLSRLLKSLELQTEQNFNYHYFQDGSVNKFSGYVKGKKQNIDKCISLYRQARLKNKEEHISRLNIGNGINQFRAYELMSKNYEHFFILEDDVILSKHYLSLGKVISKHLKNNIFSASLGFKRWCKPHEINQNLDKIIIAPQAGVHWWGELVSSKQWQIVRPSFLKYYKLIENCDYQRIPKLIIRAMFHHYGLLIPQASQDAGRDFALHLTNMKRVTTVVNRGMSIGEIGMHFNYETYKRMKLDEQRPYEFESDEYLKDFKL